MAPVIAAHRAASALVVVLIALSMLARDDPEMAGALAMVCDDPSPLIMLLVMLALAIPEQSPAR